MLSEGKQSGRNYIITYVMMSYLRKNRGFALFSSSEARNVWNMDK